jgi:hypothetical protein
MAEMKDLRSRKGKDKFIAEGQAPKILLEKALSNMLNGAPRIYDTPAELARGVVEYFEACHSDGQPLTITGLTIWLGFASRQSFYDYEKEVAQGFSYIAKTARLLIENSYETKLDNAYCTGAIFALKNMGWTDQRVNVNVPLEQAQVFKIGDQSFHFGPSGVKVVDLHQGPAGTYSAAPDTPPAKHSSGGEGFLPDDYLGTS